MKDWRSKGENGPHLEAARSVVVSVPGSHEELEESSQTVSASLSSVCLL